MNKPLITFFGSGPVAAKSLKLLTAHTDIEVVITKPRPPHHTGDVPVLALAEKLNLPVKTVSNKQELDELLACSALKSQLAILIDFGIIVSQKAISHFSLGIINSHFSLLPRWRGADPITFAILEGDSKTGVSLMLIDEGLDTGKLLTQKTFHLPDNITTPELSEELIKLSDSLLIKYVPSYIRGEIKLRQQPHPNRATYSRKLTKADGIINWNKSAIEIEREIRAFHGWPGSRTTLYGKDVIITQADTMSSSIPKAKIGDTSVIKNAGTLAVSTANGTLVILKLKPSGKREMSAKDFIAGYVK